MAVVASARPRVRVDGKFFRLGDRKCFVKGVAYGPFAPNAAGQLFASPEQTRRDLTQIHDLEANLVRVYHPPPRWFLDLAEEHGLKVLVDIPWNKQLCFDSETRRRDAREAVRRAVAACNRHPAVFAFSVANEIPSDVVRWMGPKAASEFVDELVREAKRLDPDALCTFTNYPPTEFLRPQNLDFICFNVYLHQRPSFQRYLARLQMLADAKPLLLGEFGVDSLREGECNQSRMLSWLIEDTFRAGLTGAVVFAYTDEWFKDGRLVEDWQMGLVTNDRRPKESFQAVQAAFRAAPRFPLARFPRISVVVACYNGEQTLKACLESLQHLNYPDYEIILVDDGSTDASPRIAAVYPQVRLIRHETNLGLSAARNTGIAEATGEIIAFTDCDCRADEDWLYYLAAGLLDDGFVGVGGPNLLPPEDSPIAAAVMVSPGGPVHVMLTDRQAEHVPGCNMAFYTHILREVGGFDPVYRKAGDDVDLCWRLQQAGHRIGFSPAAFVWHYRRSTLGAYLKQQQGYGEAEALLVQKHPENFNAWGGGVWRGRIYAPAKFGVEVQPPVIYHGLFGSAGFQKLYASEPARTLMLGTSLEYHLFVTLPLWVLSVVIHHFLPLAVASLLLPLGVCVAAGAQAALPENKIRWWSRPLVALLFFLQPIVRGWARYRGRFALRTLPLASQTSLDSLALRAGKQPLGEVQYWSEKRFERLAFVARMLQRLEQQGWPKRSDVGWSDYDVEILGSRWSHLQVTTVVEDHSDDRQLLRCRLRPTTSLEARLAFGLVLGLDLLVIGIAATWRPWSWLLLLLLPLLSWLFLRNQRNLQSVITVFLDHLAKEYGLAKIEPEPTKSATENPLARQMAGPSA